MVDSKRLFTLKQGKKAKGPVVYWMSRDQRIFDNWALLYAAQQANMDMVPLSIVFALSPSFPNANIRHYKFMLDGLKDVEEKSTELGISFHLLLGKPEETIPEFIHQQNASLLISDFDPLSIKRTWKDSVNAKISIPHIEVDSHNIVPCRIASQKAEFAAYTIRPKIKKLLSQFLTEFPQLPPIKEPSNNTPISWEKAIDWLKPDMSVMPIIWLKPGYSAGSLALKDFVDNRLAGYSNRRNDPLANGQSNLSPYLHFGHISAQRVTIEITKSTSPPEDKAAYLEELIVRRELSDNFCLYNTNYDNFKGVHQWAAKTLNEHRNDEREHKYPLYQFEEAKTHDKLWNAAQIEMVKTGKMHGFMRMYWAKKILEWTISPEQAFEIATQLNDKYSLDGRDPNGYAGIAWSIGGVHDRAWGERSIFGKIRYMNYNGCKRKFDVNGYITKWIDY